MDNNVVFANVVTLLVTEDFDLNEITALILSADSPEVVLSEILDAQPNLIEYILKTNQTEDKLVDFVRSLSRYFDLNILNSEKDTVMHVIAKKNLPILADLVLNQKLSFKTEINHFVKNIHGLTPTDVAGNETKDLFSKAQQNDLVSRIVLVTSFATSSVINFLYASEQGYLVDFPPSSKSVINALELSNTLIADGGVIGAHLDFRNKAYEDTFIDRAHTHWTWNQLCQANSGGNWEDAVIAVLEPLQNFSTIYGCAPYDTMIMGPHQLSEQSIILVPNDAVERLKVRLQTQGGYQGRVLGYDPTRCTIREAINATIAESYPRTSTLYNGLGEDISRIITRGQGHGFNFRYGHFTRLLIDIDGNRLPLMRGEAEILLPTLAEYKRGKHIGMHDSSATDMEADRDISSLKELSEKPDYIERHRTRLAFGLDSPTRHHPSLYILCAYRHYRTLHTHYTADTGAHDYADYLLIKAIIADLRGYHQFVAHGSVPLSQAELESMVESQFKFIVETLNNSPPTIFISLYRTILEKSYTLVKVPRQEGPVLAGASRFSIWQEPTRLPALLAEQASGPNASSNVTQEDDEITSAP